MYEISREQALEIRERMRSVSDTKGYRRLEAVALRGEGKTNAEVSEITQYHPDTVGRFAKEYSQYGVEYLVEDGRKGGNHRNASEEEQRAFLSRFEEAGKSGHIITVEEIAEAYDKRFGIKHKSQSTVYYMLRKLGWRKVMPRSKRPNKASEEACEASKE